MIYDLRLLYIPSVDQLENYMYNDTLLLDIEMKHSILKKMDIIVEQHTGMIPVSEVIDPTTGLLTQANEVSYNHYKVGIGRVEIRLTNKEI